jgi:hypothetical protein
MIIDQRQADEIAEYDRLHPKIWRGDLAWNWLRRTFPADARVLEPYAGRLLEDCPESIVVLHKEVGWYWDILWKIDPQKQLEKTWNEMKEAKDNGGVGP